MQSEVVVMTLQGGHSSSEFRSLCISRLDLGMSGPLQRALKRTIEPSSFKLHLLAPLCSPPMGTPVNSPSRSGGSFPKIEGVYWFNTNVLIFTPLIALYGILYVPLQRPTAIFAFVYYVISMIGVTAGYHRLWSHRAYNASAPLRLFLALTGGSAVQGSAYWWARRHRSHHRYTDTDQDPYNSKRGLLWTHIGWMMFKTTDVSSGKVDVSDLIADRIVQWQHRNYLLVLSTLGYFAPAAIPGMLWGDWLGGFCYASCLRMTIGHHSVFCVNSLAHYIGSAPYDDKLTPRDHFVSAVLTMGEGYHNFHHQFPMDYRNAYRWYQFDPTKWFIALCGALGFATNLRRFPSNEVEKGAYTMRLKELRATQEQLKWPTPVEKLPVVSWDTFQSEAKAGGRILILVSGFIHDVSAFLDEHPGGRTHLTANSGKDMTASFFGGVYDHSNAAHNLLAMMRVGILAGGVECLGEDHDHDATPPSQRYQIIPASKLGEERS
ncbi:delta 9-fatty acid desaturase protein [Lenzites betulinus]|nr:delta 9-fatty acid desaturase protein [Lenzites betulinus]